MAQGLDSTKIPGHSSHEAIEETGEESGASKLDKIAMESAKRAGNRISSNETKIPGNSEFTH